MSTLYVFAVYDTAAQMYLNPMHFPAPGLAARSFADEVNRAAEDNIIYKHPEDFELHELGQLSTVTGRYTQGDGLPQRISRARDLIINKA